MKTSLVGGFYNDIVTECSIPGKIDVSAADYVAKSFNKNAVENGEQAKQLPFIICHKEEITLRVVTWLGKEITWTFTPGPYPMPLKKVLKHTDNSITSDIQISY